MLTDELAFRSQLLSCYLFRQYYANLNLILVVFIVPVGRASVNTHRMYAQLLLSIINSNPFTPKLEKCKIYFTPKSDIFQTFPAASTEI